MNLHPTSSIDISKLPPLIFARTRRLSPWDRLMVEDERPRRHRGGCPPFERIRKAEIKRLIAYRHNGRMPDTDDADIYEEALAKWYLKAEALGRKLRLLDRERTACRIRTIRPIDVTAKELLARRKAKDRERKQAARLAKGSVPREQALTRTKPWTEAGISRATWYRRRLTEKSRDTFPSEVPLSVKPLAPVRQVTPQSGKQVDCGRICLTGIGVSHGQDRRTDCRHDGAAETIVAATAAETERDQGRAIDGRHYRG